MLTFHLSILLYIYAFFLLIWLVFFLVSIYHMVKFGFRSLTAYFTTVIFISVSVLMIAVSAYYITGIDWTAEITVFQGYNSTNQLY